MACALLHVGILLTILLPVVVEAGAPSFRFGRLFNTPPCNVSRENILLLSAPGVSSAIEDLGYMEDSSTRGTDNNAQDRAVAGLTYLGQFISHDMAAFDPADFSDPSTPPLTPRRAARLRNKATAFLDLDTLYEHAGNIHPRDPDNPAKLLIGNPQNPNDWARDANGKARIADMRNEEHLIISQLAALFARLHNRFVDELPTPPCTFRFFCLRGKRTRANQRFALARKQVTLHWQSIILTDWLPLFVTSTILNDVYVNGPKWFVGRAARRGTIPLEFTVGTHRLGHSIGRGRYALNGVQLEADGAPKRFRIFPLDEEEARPENNLLGNRPITEELVIEWNRFFNFSTSIDGDIANDVSQFAGLQVYRRIDRLYARPLMRLPILGERGLPSNPIGGASNSVAQQPVISLAMLDLIRGRSVGLPCGISQAGELASNGELQLDLLNLNSFDLFRPREENGAALPEGSLGDVPFLLYLLQEGRTQNEGERLGEIGGRIEAEVIIEMIRRSQISLLRQRRPWRSVITCRGSFTMVDLIQYVQGDILLGDCS